MKEWNPAEKPPADVCPQQFCFCWLGSGSLHAAGVYRGVEEAMQNLPYIPEGRCGLTLGLCSRRDPLRGDADYYEPHEPTLEEFTLPWFYFIPSAGNLVESERARYSKEAHELWDEDVEL